MKKITFIFLAVGMSLATFAQIQIDRKIQFTGATTDAKIEGIKDVSAAQDAVSAEVIQQNGLTYAPATNSGDAYSVSLTPTFASLTGGHIIHFRAAAANTGAVTLNVNGIGAKDVRKNFDVALVANDFKAGQLVSVMYDATNDLFQMLTQTGNAAGGGGGGVPTGVVMMWSGSIGSIPSGYAICDGTNGTPDLRDRFIVGAGSTYSVAATGGEATHILTVAEMPPHTHNIGQGSGACGGFCGPGNSNAAVSSSTGGGLAHENRPPYYAMAYIMKL